MSPRAAWTVALAGVLLAAVACLLSPGHAVASLDAAWPPFVLVVGLLLVGAVADADGLFDRAAAGLAALPVGPRGLLAACVALVALTTALLNLDTAAVFLTPLLVRVATRRGLPTDPFLYGTVFMVNASSLFLPGSNLTNLLVLRSLHTSGSGFAEAMLPAALAASLVTGAGVVAIFRRTLVGGTGAAPVDPARPWLGAGLPATSAAAGLILALANPALPVLAVGLLAAALSRLPARLAWRSVNPPFLLGVFAGSVALGVLARSWSAPQRIMRGSGRWGSAAVAALACLVLNNLPAAVLFSASRPAHPRALLVGLNLGPNLAVTGSLSAALWWQAARSAGAHPSARRFTRLGALLTPPAMACAIGAALLISSGAVRL